MNLFVLLLLSFAAYNNAAVQSAELFNVCTPCVTLVASMENFVLSNYTVHQTEVMMQSTCALLGANFETVCDGIVTKGIHTAFGYLQDNYSPSYVCYQVGFCGEPDEAPGVVKRDNIESIQKYASNLQIHDACQACELVGTLLHDVEVGGGFTNDQVEKMMKHFCGFFHGSQESLCHYLINNHVTKLIEEGPGFCTKMGVCKTPNRQLSAQNAQITKQLTQDLVQELHMYDGGHLGMSCDRCKTMVQFFEHYLSTNNTQDQLKNLLDEYVCGLLDGWQYKLQCKLLSSQIPNFIHMMDQNFGPERICQQFGMCVAVNHSTQRVKRIQPAA